MSALDAARAWQRPVMTAFGIGAAGFVLWRTDTMTLAHFHACLWFLAALYAWRGAVDKGGVKEILETWRRRDAS